MGSWSQNRFFGYTGTLAENGPVKASRKLRTQAEQIHINAFISCTLVVNTGGDDIDAQVQQLDLHRRKSQEALFKPDTNERYLAAESSIGDGAKKKGNVQTTFDLSDFYNPKSWESMLSDNDYQELDETVKKAKAAQWKSKKKDVEELDNDYDTAESDNTSEEMDLDEYEPADVPAVEVQLDEDSRAVSQMDAEEVSKGHENGASETADDAAAWMDVFGADPEYARVSANKDTVMDKWLTEDDVTSGEKSATDLMDVDGSELGGDIGSDNVDPVYDVEAGGTRRKRSYRSYDDDYGSAYIKSEDDTKSKKSGNVDTETSSTDDQDFDDDTSENAESESDVAETEAVDEAVLDDDNAQVDVKDAYTEDDNLLSVDDNSETSDSDTSEKLKEKKGKLKSSKASFDDDYDDILAASDQYRRLKSRKRNGKTTADGYKAVGTRLRKGDERISQNVDSQGENVYAGDALEADANAYNPDRPVDDSYRTEYYPDRKISDGSSGKRKVRKYGQKHHDQNSDNIQADNIIADADVDYIYRDEFENYEKSRDSPVKRRQTARRSHTEKTNKKRRRREKVNEATEFDDDYQFESEGTVEYARQKVCSFVAQQLPSYGFTGVMKPAESECDVLCERSNKKQTVFHTFHLKNWPCGENQKGRCSNDGKCDEVSYQNE